MSLAGVCAVAVIAKAPRPGHVKTRMLGALTPEQAAALGAAFLQDTLANLAAAARLAPIAPVIAYAPRGEEARLDALWTGGAARLLADGGDGAAPGVEGFGQVLLHTMRALLGQGYGAACVLGADSPTLPTGELVRAARLLLGGEHDAVFGAAEDGGYWLLGLREPHPSPFADIAWSTGNVAETTRLRLRHAGLRAAELATWYDVDDPPSLRRLEHDLRMGRGYEARHTQAALTSFALHAVTEE